jgi:hypothetical protein
MLKKDKVAFLDFVSCDKGKRSQATQYFNDIEEGYFEDHPLTKKLVKENITNLEVIISGDGLDVEKEWAIQFCADVEYVSEKMKPEIYNLLSSGSCNFIPVILWCISQNTNTFSDVGPILLSLTNHKDREVRWRIPYVILHMPFITEGMVSAVQDLKKDKDQTTQHYIERCVKSKKWPNK